MIRNFNLNFYVKALLCLSIFILAGCTQDQDDIDLPIYDAIGSDFTLPSTQGTELTLSDYKGKIVLLNFGYTNCPDVCPMVLTRLAEITDKLERQYGVTSTKLQTLFITVDPERDSIPLLVDYLEFFNKNFIGIGGTNEQIADLAKSYSVFYEKQDSDVIGYQVTHTDKIFLLDKRGRLRGLFGSADPDDNLINAIVSLASAKI